MECVKAVSEIALEGTPHVLSYDIEGGKTYAFELTCLLEGGPIPKGALAAVEFFDATGGLFDYNAFAGYVIVKMVADAMEKTGSDSPVVIAKKIREGRFVQPGYAYPLSYTEWGEMKEFAPIIYTFKPGDPPGRIFPGSGWQMEIVFRSPPVKPYVPEK